MVSLFFLKPLPAAFVNLRRSEKDIIYIYIKAKGKAVPI